MIESVLGDADEQVAILRRFGQNQVADAVEAILAGFRDELVEYLTWHDEAGAVLMSGRRPLAWRRPFVGVVRPGSLWSARQDTSPGVPKTHRSLETTMPGVYPRPEHFRGSSGAA